MDDATRTFLPDTLVVDIEKIDDQHAALFARLNNLKMHCVGVHDLPLGELDELMLSLRVHCATEEQLADEAGLDFDRHARKHEKMLAAIAKAIAEVGEHNSEIFNMIRYIEYWFERHIREEDRDFGLSLRQAMICRAAATAALFPLANAASA